MKRLLITVLLMLSVVGCSGVTLSLPDIFTPPTQKLINYHQDRIDIDPDLIYSYGGHINGVSMIMQFKGRTLLGFRTYPGIPVPDNATIQRIEPF